MQTVISLVACGMGFALVPASVQNLRRQGVQYQPLQGPAAAIELGILSACDNEDPVSRNFVATLVRVARTADVPGLRARR